MSVFNVFPHFFVCKSVCTKNYITLESLKFRPGHKLIFFVSEKTYLDQHVSYSAKVLLKLRTLAEKTKNCKWRFLFGIILLNNDLDSKLKYKRIFFVAWGVQISTFFSFYAASYYLMFSQLYLDATCYQRVGKLLVASEKVILPFSCINKSNFRSIKTFIYITCLNSFFRRFPSNFIYISI